MRVSIFNFFFSFEVLLIYCCTVMELSLLCLFGTGTVG